MMTQKRTMRFSILTAVTLSVGSLWFCLMTEPTLNHQGIASEGQEESLSRVQLKDSQVVNHSVMTTYHSFFVSNQDHLDNQNLDEISELTKLLVGILENYHSENLSTEQQREIAKILPELAQHEQGRMVLAKVFFDAQEKHAKTLYDAILDANLKNTPLLVEFIEFANSNPSVEAKWRLIDLIADAHTIDQTYHEQIAHFLANTVISSEVELSEAALAQWIWYVNRYHGVASVMDTYLFHQSAQVRAELYEVIEADAVNSESEKGELLLALNTLRYADYLEINHPEKQRIAQLQQRLQGD